MSEATLFADCGHDKGCCKGGSDRLMEKKRQKRMVWYGNIEQGGGEPERKTIES